MNFFFYGITDPGLLMNTVFHSRNAGGGTNRNNYRNPAVDRLIDQVVGETNPKQRAELLNKIQATVLEDAVMVYLAEPVALYGYDHTVSGIWFDWGGNNPSFYDARVAG